jgi:hypothetical protein
VHTLSVVFCGSVGGGPSKTAGASNE